MLLAFFGGWVAPFVAVLTSEFVEARGHAVDGAFGGFARFGADDCCDGDVGFAVEFSVVESPFVVVDYCFEERSFGGDAADHLAADLGTGFEEGIEGFDCCWSE